MTEIQIGDIVRFDECFYSDPHCFMSIVQCNPVLDQIGKTMDIDYSAWFERLQAKVVGFHHGDMIELEVVMMFQVIHFSCWHDELIPTDERITPNDPSLYDRTLL